MNSLTTTEATVAGLNSSIEELLANIRLDIITNKIALIDLFDVLNFVRTIVILTTLN